MTDDAKATADYKRYVFFLHGGIPCCFMGCERDDSEETVTLVPESALLAERASIGRDLVKRAEQYRIDGYEQIADEFYRVGKRLANES